jgi:phosphoenolpyruvate phosphomutase
VEKFSDTHNSLSSSHGRAAPLSRTARLRSLTVSPRLEFIMEAHNGLSAFIVQEAGFKAIWASGFAISASLGLPDNNEASFSEILQVVEYIADRTSIPILMDGDTGFGDYNNVRRLVRKVEQRGVAGICIEDKTFPKRNSFVRGACQPLAYIEEFCGKIKAAKDAQHDKDFVLVARTEAFIVGAGLEEALRRADAYADAGADAILVHSAKPTADEVLAFKRAWSDRLPVVVVPTMYYTTPTSVLAAAGFSVCIWANHLMRASVSAMQCVAGKVHACGDLMSVEAALAPLDEVFRIQGEAERGELESKYLPSSRLPRLILLPAARKGELTSPDLRQVLSAYQRAGLTDVVLVRELWVPETAPHPRSAGADEHDAYSDTWSLWQVRERLNGVCFISTEDTTFRREIPNSMLDCPHDIAICFERKDGSRPETPPVLTVFPSSHSNGIPHRRVVFRVPGTGNQDTDGELMWLLRLSARGTEWLFSLLERCERRDSSSLSMPGLLAALLDEGHEVHVYTDGCLQIEVMRAFESRGHSA